MFLSQTPSHITHKEPQCEKRFHVTTSSPLNALRVHIVRSAMKADILWDTHHIIGFVQDRSISSALAIEILQSCTKLSTKSWAA